MIDFNSSTLMGKLSLLFGDCSDLLTKIDEINRAMESDDEVTLRTTKDQFSVSVSDILPGLECAISIYNKELSVKEQEIKTLIYGDKFLQSAEITSKN